MSRRRGGTGSPRARAPMNESEAHGRKGMCLGDQRERRPLMLPSSRSPYLQNLSSAVAAITIVLCASYALAAGPTQQELDDAARSTDSWLTTNKSYDGHRY